MGNAIAKLQEPAETALSWFSEHVARSQAGPYMEIVEVTSEMARRILEANPGNRYIDRRAIACYAHDMRAERWMLNGETIVISREGLLNDGQQRLLALIEAQAPVTLAIVWGVDRDSRYTVDMGKARSAGNFLAMKGVTNAYRAAVTARLVIGFRAGFSAASADRRWRLITKTDVFHEVATNQDLFDRICRDYGNRRFSHAVRARSVIPAAYMIVSEFSRIEDRNRIDEFFTALLTGTDLGRFDPVLWLRQVLMGWDTQLRTRGEEKLECVLRYWNFWAERKVMHRAAVRLTGKYPEIV